MKRITLLLLIAGIMFLLQPSVVLSEEEQGGIIIGETLITPGQKAILVFSNLGFPEQFYAMRGKKSQNEDYIKFDYVDYGLIFSVTNGENLIKAIYVLKRDVKLKGIPFKVGDSYEVAKKAWGEPDKKESGYANFFYKGVTLKVSDEGVIELIAIYKPGKVDYDEMRKT